MKYSDFWAKAHRDGNTSMVTGTDPVELFRDHRLDIPTGKRVADIGYGNGTLNKFLSKHNEVVSFDVVEIPGVRHISALADEDPFDLGICHLVAQHTPPEEMGMLVPPLKPDGIFSLQFGVAPEDGYSAVKSAPAPHYVYTVKTMLDLVGLRLVGEWYRSFPGTTENGWPVRWCFLRFMP